MATKNGDDNIFDEKILAKKIAEEEDLLTQLQMELADKQERKKKVATNIRTISHKIKVLEEDITKNAILVENLKKHKEKYVAKVDKKSVNRQIDKKCDDIFTGLLQTVDPKAMPIEVEFEGLKTTFTISDHKINDHYGGERETEDGGSKASIREGSFRGSFISTDNNMVKKEKKEFICRTFGQMKDDIAAFFSLNTEDFFFADAQDGVFLDDLPIRPTLFPFGQKITKTTPKLKIMLTHNAKLDEMIYQKIREQIGDDDVVDNTQNKAELKEAYDNEQARKKADLQRKKAFEYYQFKKNVYKMKGLVSSLLYVALITLWLYNVFTTFDFDRTFMMRNATQTVFATYSAPSTVTFYDELSNQLVNTTSADTSYGFVHFTYVMPAPVIVSMRYKKIDCTDSNSYMQKYYPPVSGTCIDPYVLEEGPVTINGTTYYYDGDKDKKVSLPTHLGTFENLGYRLTVNFSDTNMHDTINSFVDPYVAKYTAFDFVFYNPSLEKMACAYRLVYRYNRDKTTVESFSFVFNVEKQSTGLKATQDLVLVIASLLILNSLFDIIDIVPASKIELDLDLVWLRKGKKGSIKEEEARRHKPKFKMITIAGTVFKFSLPSVVNLLNLLSVSLNIAVASLDIARQKSIEGIDFTTGTGIDCPGLVSRKLITDILYVVVILLMMIVLLRYIAQFVPFLNNFVVIIQNLVRNTASMGFIIFWLFLTMAVFGTFTFGAFYPQMDNFIYVYMVFVLILMRKNTIFESNDDMTYFDRMNINIGTAALVGLILFAYIVITFIILKIITSIVIKSIDEAEANQKEAEQNEEMLRDESLTLIRERFYEDYRLMQSKERAKLQQGAGKEVEKKENSKKKK